MGSMGSPRYIETLEAVDAIRERCCQRQLTPEQFTAEVTDVFYDYLVDEDPRDDVVGLVDYCVQIAREVCELTLFADRVLPHRLDHQLRWILDQQGDAETLGQVVRRLRVRLEQNSRAVKQGLINLGYRVSDTQTPIVPVVIGDQDRTFRFWKELFDCGLFTNPVTQPAVMAG